MSRPQINLLLSTLFLSFFPLLLCLSSVCIFMLMLQSMYTLHAQDCNRSCKVVTVYFSGQVCVVFHRLRRVLRCFHLRSQNNDKHVFMLFFFLCRKMVEKPRNKDQRKTIWHCQLSIGVNKPVGKITEKLVTLRELNSLSNSYLAEIQKFSKNQVFYK